MTMLTAEALYAQAQALLRHIHDYDYLQAHPLAEALCPQLAPNDPGRGQQLRRIILRAIERLSPPGAATPQAREWLRYYILSAHYVEGRDAAELLDELAISERQFYREQRQALHALAGLLWDEAQAAQGACPPAEPPGQAAPRPPLDLREEVEALAAGHETVDLAALLPGVLEAVAALAPRPIPLTYRAPPDLPPVPGHRTVLRQVFIHLLGRCLLRPETQGVEAALEEQGSGEESGGQGAAEENAPPVTRNPQHIMVTLRVLGAEAGIEAALDLDTVRSFLGGLGGEWLGVGPMAGGVALRFRLPTGARRTVLAIENNAGAVQLLQRYLTPYGYQVVGAADGGEALALVDELAPDLILLDIMLPQQDGWEVLKMLKSDPAAREVPVLICSVLYEPHLATALGAEGYLQKPFTQAQALAALRALSHP